MRGELASRVAFNEIVPNGNDACRVRIEDSGTGALRLQSNGQCAYYCGPGASLEGKTFTRMEKAEQVTDIAGDPLC